jgi:hypothetical protein
MTRAPAGLGTWALGLLLLLGTAVHNMTWENAELWPGDGAVAGVDDHKPSARPLWTPELGRHHHGCTAERFDGFRRILVIRGDGRSQALPFDEAWRRTHNRNRADDVWVVGYCGPAGL